MKTLWVYIFFILLFFLGGGGVVFDFSLTFGSNKVLWILELGMHIVDVSIMINNELYGKDKYIVPNFNLSFKTLVGASRNQFVHQKDCRINLIRNIYV